MEGKMEQKDSSERSSGSEGESSGKEEVVKNALKSKQSVTADENNLNKREYKASKIRGRKDSAHLQRKDSRGGVALSLDVVKSGLSDLSRNLVNMKFTYSKFNASKRNLDSIDILNEFIHLRFVDVSDNSISDLTPLSSLEFLEVLNASKNKIRRPERVPKHQHLKHLNLSKNLLKTMVGFSPNYISHLDLRDNELETLEGMTNSIFTSLTHLELRGNKIPTLSPIDLPRLEKLYAADNLLVNINGLDKCPMLKVLHLRSNHISRLKDFPSLVRLEYVNLRGNAIKRFTETTALMHSPNIRTLIMADNPISESINYRSEMVIANPQIRRLDKIQILDSDIEEGRNIFRCRMRGQVPPIQDDPNVLTPPTTPIPLTHNTVENLVLTLASEPSVDPNRVCTSGRNSCPPNTPASNLVVSRRNSSQDGA